jgi:hypothetical protein
MEFARKIAGNNLIAGSRRIAGIGNPLHSTHLQTLWFFLGGPVVSANLGDFGVRRDDGVFRRLKKPARQRAWGRIRISGDRLGAGRRKAYKFRVPRFV